jgi:predicted metal-dependent enzyme (double-stranded beta helix superfamily)
MSTTFQPMSSASVRSGRLLGARQLADVVRRLAANPAEWLTRVRLNPEGRWYERIHLGDGHEVWVISWLPGQATGFHDHGGSAGAFAVVWGTLLERRVAGGVATGQVLTKPVGAGGSRSFGPRYIHDVRNAAASAVAVSVHAYSPPLPEMTRYELTPDGLVTLGTEGPAAWLAAGRQGPGPSRRSWPPHAAACSA